MQPLQETRPEPAPADLWHAVQAEARDLVRKEPLLNGFVTRMIVNDGTFAQALSVRLADLLQAPGFAQGPLAALFEEVAAADARIANAAARDLQAVRERDPSCTTYLHALMNFKGFQALVAYRVAHALWASGRSDIASWIANRVSLVLGPDIHPAARIGSGIMLDHGSGIVIGETAVVEDDVSILQNVTLGGTGKIAGDRHPKVRRGVMIGAGAKILGNIEIGADRKAAAGSVVLKSVPPRCTVAGVPAQIVRIHGAHEAPAMTMDQNF